MHNGQQAAEVVVVGAGCIGASVAVHLAMAGQREVVLVEKNEPAAMTTGRSSAIVRQHYSEPTFTHWALESLSIWHRFDEIFGVEPVFTRTGWVIAVDRRTWSRCATALSSSARSASTHVRFHVMSWSRWNHLRNLTISRVRPMSRKQATAIRRGHHGDWPIRRYWLATSEPFRGGIQS